MCRSLPDHAVCCLPQWQAGGWDVTAASGCLGALASLLLWLQNRLQPAHSSPAPASMAGADLVEQREPEGFVSVLFLPAKKSLGPFRSHPC